MSLAPILGWAAEPSTDQVPAAAPQSKASGDDATQLKALQEERIKILTGVLSLVTGQYHSGMVDISRVTSAENELFNAQLESADGPEKRVALLTKQLEMADDVVKLSKLKLDTGLATHWDVDQAKTAYLGVKIKLLRERSRKEEIY
jgi:outer membrane protein TolC